LIENRQVSFSLYKSLGIRREITEIAAGKSSLRNETWQKFKKVEV